MTTTAATTSPTRAGPQQPQQGWQEMQNVTENKFWGSENREYQMVVYTFVLRNSHDATVMTTVPFTVAGDAKHHTNKVIEEEEE